MVADIVEVLTGAFTSLGTAVANFVITAFNTLIYIPADGATPGQLTGLATWGLVFGGISLVLGIVNRFVRY